MPRRFESSGPLRGTLRPPPDKSVSHRAALIAAMAEGETTIEGYLDSADTRSTLTAIEALGAEVIGHSDGPIRAESARTRGRTARSGGGRNRRRQRRNPAATPARLAGGSGGRCLDARRRRVDPPPPGRPGRGAAASDGGPLELPRGPPAAAADRGGAVARHLLRAAGGERAGQVLSALRRPARRGRDARRRAAAEPRPQRADAGRGRRRDRARRRRRLGAPRGAAGARRDRGARRLLLRRLLPRRGAARAGQRRQPRPESASTRPGPACSRSLPGWAPRSRSSRRESAAASRAGRSESSPRPCAAPRSAARTCRWRSTSCHWSRSPPASPRVRRRSATRPSCGARRATGSRPSSEALTALGAEVETSEDGMLILGSGGLRGGSDRLPRRPPHRDAGCGRRTGLAQWRRGRGDGRRRGQLSGLRVRPPAYSAAELFGTVLRGWTLVSLVKFI